MLRFWLDRGVDGIRIDSAALVVKDATLEDFTEGASEGQHPVRRPAGGARGLPRVAPGVRRL